MMWTSEYLVTWHSNLQTEKRKISMAPILFIPWHGTQSMEKEMMQKTHPIKWMKEVSDQVQFRQTYTVT